MTPIANVLTDLYLSLAALVGLTILHMTLTRDDALTRRFVFAVRATMMLFAGRALVVLTGGEAFRFLVMLGAGLIPLAVLLLTEGLLRRHAPPWIKVITAGGATLFVLLSFVPPVWIDPARLWALLFYQLAIFGLCGWLVVTRDKSSLSGAENITVVRLALSLIFFIPLIGLDYGTIILGVPVQLSAIGALTLCWLALTLGSDTQGQRASVIALCYALSVSGLAGLLIGGITGNGTNGFILGMAITLSAILLVMIAIDARRQQLAKQSLTILRHLATGPIDDPLTFLRGLQGFPSVEGALIIEAEDLADLRQTVLEKLLAKSPVLRRADPLPSDPEEADHITHIFDRFAVSHILKVGTSPLRLVALAMPSLSASPHAELEVQVVQRMAALIDERA